MSNINNAVKTEIIKTDIFDTAHQHVIFECQSETCPHVKCLFVRRFRPEDEPSSSWEVGDETGIDIGFGCTYDRNAKRFKVISIDDLEG